MRQYTFSDGTVVPKGVSIVAPIRSIHHDETVYTNAERFDPLRFYNQGENGGEDSKQSAANTSLEFLHFGYGRHAW